MKIDDNELFKEAVFHVAEVGRASCLILERNFDIGYARAYRMLERMRAENLIGENFGNCWPVKLENVAEYIELPEGIIPGGEAAR